jgi:hypothetical protein
VRKREGDLILAKWWKRYYERPEREHSAAVGVKQADRPTWKKQIRAWREAGIAQATATAAKERRKKKP